MTPVDDIRENLTRKLETYKLKDRITFDDSALEELRKISGGNWEHAELYAGTAILDALQNQRNKVTATHIQELNIAEAIHLMLGGRDIWDNVRYIGTKVPDMLPEGVQLRRTLALWDANRDRNASDSVRDGKLPQYVLTDKIQYAEQGILGQPEVQIPFKYKPSRTEVQAVAQSLANFVSQNTGETHEVGDMSDRFSVQYFVQPVTKAGTDPLLNRPNYRVREGFAFGIEGAQGVVSIEREAGSRHDKKTLETYVQSIKPKVQ